MKRLLSILLAISATISAQIVPSTGNVRGPTSATDNAVARYDGTTGKLIQNSTVTIDDSGNLTVSGTGTSSVAGAFTVGTTSGALTALNDFHHGSGGTKGFWNDTGLYGPSTGDFIIRAGNDSNSTILAGNSSGSHAVIKANGNLLLGTTTDAGYKLYVKGSNDAQAMLDVASGSQYTSLAFANNGTGKGFAYWDNTNNTFAFGTYAANSVVKFNTGLGITALTLESSQNATFAGNLKLSAYGAGTLTTDSSGNVTATSDERAKNITGTFTKGLAEVVKLTPKTYTWKPETGLNTTDEVASLTAQDLIAAGIPEAVSTYRTVADFNDDGTPKLDADGKPLTKRIDATYTVSDRAVIAALVNAVKELKAEVDALKAVRN